MVLVKGGCGERNTYVFLMRANSTETQKVLFCISSCGQLKPKTVFLQFYNRILPTQNIYTLIEISPDVIYASVLLSIELIFSGESFFLLIFNTGRKGRQT